MLQVHGRSGTADSGGVADMDADLDKEDCCVVCLDSAKEMMFTPCCHMVSGQPPSFLSLTK